MQIEGFWYYLFLGVFEASTIHYEVAKIFGPIIFGCGWCGYACWTAMVLDLLPYKIPQQMKQNVFYVLSALMNAKKVHCIFDDISTNCIYGSDYIIGW